MPSELVVLQVNCIPVSLHNIPTELYSSLLIPLSYNLFLVSRLLSVRVTPLLLKLPRARVSAHFCNHRHAITPQELTAGGFGAVSMKYAVNNIPDMTFGCVVSYLMWNRQNHNYGHYIVVCVILAYRKSVIIEIFRQKIDYMKLIFNLANNNFSVGACVCACV